MNRSSSIKNLFLFSALLGFLASCSYRKEQSVPIERNFEPATGGESVLIFEGTDSANFGSKSVAAIVGDNLLTLKTGLLKIRGDVVYKCFNRNVWQLGRSKQDFLARSPLSRLGAINGEYKLIDHEDIAEGKVSVSPSDVVPIDNDRLFVTRYDSKFAWIINTNSTSSFRERKVYLGHYADEDGHPEMGKALVHNGKLYIALQRLHREDWPTPWNMKNTAYVSVYDIDSMTEINTAINSDFFGIPLTVKNPYGEMRVFGNYLFVPGAGNLMGVSNEAGGIEKINVQNHKLREVFFLGENVVKVEILNSEIGFFLNYKGPEQVKVVPFDPYFGTVKTLPFTPEIFNGHNVSDIEIDGKGRLWVSVLTGDRKGIWVIDGKTGNVKAGPISIEQDPVNIEICR